MPIYKGDKNTESVYKGSIEIAKVYKGSSLVYENYKDREYTGIPPITLYNCKKANMLNYTVAGNSLQGGVPNIYQPIEYVENTSGSYINIDYIPPIEGFKVEVEFKQTSTNKNDGCFVFGSYDDTTTKYRPSLYLTTTTYKFDIYHSTSPTHITTNKTCESDTDYKATITVSGSNLSYDISGTTGSISNYTPPTNTVPFYLFTQYPSAAKKCKVQIKSFKVYDKDNNLCVNLVPCKRLSDSVVGVYDNVRDRFFTNSGTGTFTAGANTGVGMYRQLSYVENTGNSYIDIGLPATTGYTVEAKLSYSAVGSGTYQYFTGFLYSTTPSIRAYWIRQNNSSAGLGYTYGSTVFASLATISANTWYVIKSELKGGTQNFYLDGTSIGSGTLADMEIPTPTKNMYMFAVNSNSGGVETPASFTLAKCEYAKYWDSYGNLIRHFVGCIRTTDNAVGMWDLVEGKFYENQGTDPFVAGDYSMTNLCSAVEIENCGDKTKNMANRPSTYSFSGFQNILPYIDKFELGVRYRISWTGATKGGDKYPGLNARGNVGWLTSSTGTGINPTGGSYTFTYTTLPDYFYVYSNGNNAQASSGVTSSIEGLMITKATETTDYEPYGYEIPVKVNDTTTRIFLSEPLRRIGDIADYIDYENQKIVRKIATRKATSSQTFSYGTLGRYTNTILCPETAFLTGGKFGTTNKICNILPVYNDTTYSDQHLQGVNNSSTGTWLYLIFNKDTLVGYSDSLTDNEVKALCTSWLRSNGFTVYYEKATYTEESITLPAIELSKGTNVIRILTKVPPSNMFIKYKGKPLQVFTTENDETIITADANTFYTRG